MLDERVPSLDDVRELYYALWRFTQCFGSKDEGRWLHAFTRLADALRPIRPAIGSTEVWPPVVGHAFREIAETFDAISAAWGWEKIAASEPARSEHLARVRETFRKRRVAPVYGAAIRWSQLSPKLARPVERVWGEPGPDVEWIAFENDRAIHRAAKEGFRLEFRAAPGNRTAERWRARYRRALVRWRAAPQFGKCFPAIDHESAEERTLSGAFGELRDELTIILDGRLIALPDGDPKGASPTAAEAPRPDATPAGDPVGPESEPAEDRPANAASAADEAAPEGAAGEGTDDDKVVRRKKLMDERDQFASGLWNEGCTAGEISAKIAEQVAGGKRWSKLAASGVLSALKALGGRDKRFPFVSGKRGRRKSRKIAEDRGRSLKRSSTV